MALLNLSLLISIRPMESVRDLVINIHAITRAFMVYDLLSFANLASMVPVSSALKIRAGWHG